tara:strand:- start:703 stop:1506 length:804 start_codon:yes stop_codon:yes gene_type:complete
MELSFDSCLIELRKIEHLLDRSIDNKSQLLTKKIGVFNIFKNLISNLIILKKLNEENCNTQSFATLSRMIIDNYAGFYLLTAHSDENEKQFRYYLYLMDSLQTRINSISDFANSLKDNKLVKSFDSSNNIIIHDKKTIATIIEKIKKEKLDTLASPKIIENRNWKYISGNSKKERYSWEELYNIAKIPEHFSKMIQNHYSTYAHGLGMTILYSERNEALINSTFLFFALIQLNLAKIIINEFEIDVLKANLDNNFIAQMEFHWDNWK